ncbi:MAG: von Willebrand factor type A domain-containing protein [Acidobacteriota bacterium]
MKRFVAVLFALTLSIVADPAPTGSVHGVIREQGGGELPGVTVTLLPPGTSVVTDTHGRYRFDGLAPATYTVRAQLEGFNAVQRSVTVGAGTSVGLEMVLPFSALAETITVTASSPPISAMRTASFMVSGADTAIEPRYRKFDDHGFIEAKKSRVTTFAIDVDRASYANVRRFVSDGLVPPPDAVRVEEMINYFPWSYPQPEGSAPFSVTTEVGGCPWNAKNRIVRIGIQGRNLERWKMAANNLVFLVDVSGSMQDASRLPLLKSAFRVLVDQLRAEDRVALVVYAGAAGLVLPSTSGVDKPTILAALDNLAAGGSTAGGEGIELAYKIAKENFLADGNNRVILATDGDFNVGLSGAKALEKLIEKKRDSGIYLSVLGVGDDNYQDDAMETLADKGNGNYAYLDSIREAEKVFRDELTGTLVTIAKDVKVQIDFDPARVVSYRQIGYENRALANEDFENDEKDAGELGAGHSVTALYEIVPVSSAASPTLARGPIATLKLRYKEPNSRKSIPLMTTITDEGHSAWDASPDMQFATAIAQFGMLLRNSPHKGTATWDDVLKLASVSRGADLDGTRAEFLKIAEAARGMK